jgi:hypothetical protein
MSILISNRSLPCLSTGLWSRTAFAAGLMAFLTSNVHAETPQIVPSPPPSPVQAPPPEQMAPANGKVTYRGTYTGTVAPLGRSRQPPTEVAGAVTIELTFEGAAVTGRFETTGARDSFRVSGVREGNGCKLYNGMLTSMVGTCSARNFQAVLTPGGARSQPSFIEFQAAAESVMDQDAIRRQREAASAADAERQERLLRSLPPVPGTASPPKR